jgi:predicted  nucleic acid-binding Zn-ribbon protein
MWVAYLGGWLFGKWAESRYVQLAEYRSDVAKAHERIAQLEAQLSESRREATNTLAKVKVLLIARLADLSKELSFWRRTVRDLVLQAGGDKRDARQLTDSITRSLNSTLSDSIG